VWPVAVAVLAVIPLTGISPYVVQVLTNAWLYALLALSLSLVAGTAGQISLGHAGLLAIGAYASALLAIDAHLPVLLA
ncbi:ABC transporter permease subunit, partial [Acinetobacter baumannii]|uniref:ABC transporter permease subunit n=3 Tax=Pseudomonadota TaxID=1224 RepID=UPI003EBF1689